MKTVNTRFKNRRNLTPYSVATELLSLTALKEEVLFDCIISKTIKRRNV